MNNLFKSKDYVWCLFVGHLVIEKLLKAVVVDQTGEHPPMIHDLLRLAQRAGLKITKEREDALDVITKFNIRGRYDDYAEQFRKTCTPRYTRHWVQTIKEIRVWLKKKQ